MSEFTQGFLCGMASLFSFVALFIWMMGGGDVESKD